jgi:aspartyl protease family protein
MTQATEMETDNAGTRTTARPASRARRWLRRLLRIAAVSASLAAVTAYALWSYLQFKPQPDQTLLTADRVPLPSREIRGFLFVEARIHGAGPFLFLVDTGAGMLLVNSHVATAAGLETDVPVQLTSSEGHATGARTKIRQLDCGGLTLRGLHAVVMPQGALDHFDHELGCKLDGVMGFPNFADVVLEMDFFKHQITVVRPHAAHLPDECAIPFTGTRPVVSLEIAGSPVDCLIDTGAAFPFGLPSTLHPADLTCAADPSDNIITTDVSGKKLSRERSQLAGEIRHGRIVWRNPPVFTSSTGAQPILGVAAMASWCVAFDQRHQRFHVLDEVPVMEWDEDAASSDITPLRWDTH